MTSRSTDTAHDGDGRVDLSATAGELLRLLREALDWEQYRGFQAGLNKWRKAQISEAELMTELLPIFVPLHQHHFRRVLLFFPQKHRASALAQMNAYSEQLRAAKRSSPAASQSPAAAAAKKARKPSSASTSSSTTATTSSTSSTANDISSYFLPLSQQLPAREAPRHNDTLPTPFQRRERAPDQRARVPHSRTHLDELDDDIEDTDAPITHSNNASSSSKSSTTSSTTSSLFSTKSPATSSTSSPTVAAKPQLKTWIPDRRRETDPSSPAGSAKSAVAEAAAASPAAASQTATVEKKRSWVPDRKPQQTKQVPMGAEEGESRLPTGSSPGLVKKGTHCTRCKEFVAPSGTSFSRKCGHLACNRCWEALFAERNEGVISCPGCGREVSRAHLQTLFL